MNQVTEALTIAIADWGSMAVQQLDQERMDYLPVQFRRPSKRKVAQAL